MILVGLTGGIAAGKSTVAAMFAARGATVVAVDRIGHALQEPGAVCHAPVVAAFGPGVMDEAGRIDRQRLGALVFADPDARRRLDDIMRPALWEACAAAIRRAETAGAGVCVVEAAILLEADRRVSALWPNGAKAARADYVVENGGDRAETEVQVERIVAALLARKIPGEKRLDKGKAPL
jgi:dephospho-CoA kinase